MQSPAFLFNLRKFCRLAAFFLVVTIAGRASEEQRVVEPIGPTPPPKVNPALPTLWVAGDSTAANGSPNATGWGKPLASYFDTTRINVANRARGGRSSKTFVHEGLWDQIVAELKAGDVVLIQFGHNDGGDPFKGKARASLPGIGEETREGTLPDGKSELAHTFGWYLRKMVNDTKAKGATPILLSLTVRNIWKEGAVERASGEYGRWSAQVAAAEGVAFIDLSPMIADAYQALGQEKVKEFFPQDYAHTSPSGADLNASLVVKALKALKPSPFGSLEPYSAKAEPSAESVAAPPVRAEARTVERKPLPVPADPKLPSLVLIGDSTVRNGQGDGSNGQWGWGEPIAEFFDTTKINVVNRAVGGLSSRTYLTGGHWERALELIKAGDFVIMQFGHNDGGAINDTSRARASIRGVGEETEAIDNLLTKKHEVVHSYGWYLRRFIADARAKGATPIVCSLVPRKKWEGGKIIRSTESHAGWAEAVAKTEGVAFIPLNELAAARYDQLGEQAVHALFADEHTHTSAAGARINAECVIAGLQALEKNPLKPFIKDPKRAAATSSR